MAKPRTAKLKVFRTPVGFHDAYVAAASRKAALAAWGSGTDLFAAGAAEVVTDPKLMREALARPGEVIRKSRGSDAEHVRALGKVKGKTAKKEAGSRIKSGMTKEVSGRRGEEGGSRIKSGMTKAKKPSRAGVGKAEEAVAVAEARQQEAAARLRTAEQALEEARKGYRQAMAEWAG